MRLSETGISAHWLIWAPLLFGGLSCAAAGASQELTLYTGPVLRTAQFVAAEGVNTHIAYTDGGYADVAEIVRELKFLGIDRVRDAVNVPGVNGSAPLKSYWEAARAGIKFDFLVGGGSFGRNSGSWTSPSLEDRLASIRWVARAEPGSVIAIEGPNEINNEPMVYEGIGGSGSEQLRAALAMQHDLYRSVRSDSLLGALPIYYFTGYGAGAIPNGPDPSLTPGLSDFNNQHPYPRGGEPPAAWVARRQVLTNGSGGPAVYTETGYTTNRANKHGVSPDVQAKYTLDLLLDTAKEGISATYLYELMDAYKPGSRQGDAGYGLFDWQRNPKPVALALRNMNAILHDTAADARTFALAPLALSFRAESRSTQVLLLQRSGGVHVVALWDEQPQRDDPKNPGKTPASFAVELAWPQPLDVAVYDPLAGGNAVRTEPAARSLHIAVADHPLLVVLSPPSATIAQ
jgi:hypothetical protein